MPSSAASDPCRGKISIADEHAFGIQVTAGKVGGWRGYVLENAWTVRPCNFTRVCGPTNRFDSSIADPKTMPRGRRGCVKALGYFRGLRMCGDRGIDVRDPEHRGSGDALSCPPSRLIPGAHGRWKLR